MRGHLRERSPGHWAIVIDVRDTETGKRKRRWHSFAGTKRGAQSECARLLTELKAGVAVAPSRETVAAFLERWIEHMKAQVSPRSLERYREICTKNVCPLIGTTVLSKLKPAQLSAAYHRPFQRQAQSERGAISPNRPPHAYRP